MVSLKCLKIGDLQSLVLIALKLKMRICDAYRPPVAHRLILDVLPVEESLKSQYDDIEKEEIINVEMFKYIDFNDHKLYSPRLQFVLDIFR